MKRLCSHKCPRCRYADFLATAQGTISYGYDKIGRRIAMSIPGQEVVNYTYDNADRLIAISQGSSTVSFAYDVADRLTSKTLPNGIVAEYDYDAGSQLSAITFRLGDSILGDLTYEYDRAGRRTKVGGSFARVDLPQALGFTSFNDANQLTQREASSLSYDASGNLVSDGVNTYTWDARNQLVAISGSMVATFQYDAFGRRISKSVNGVSTSYLYDDWDVVQEQSSTAPVTNLLVAGLDSPISRTDGTGTRTLISDALGSTLGLIDEAGALQTEYRYEPFGRVTIAGAASMNPSQYTGRENDGTGLYFYRTRYYSPVLQRFISEDPLGFAAGDVNLYAYVSNDPINLADPLGLEGGLIDYINSDSFRKDRGFWGNTWEGIKGGLRWAGNFNPGAHIASKVIDVVVEGRPMEVTDAAPYLLGGVAGGLVKRAGASRALPQLSKVPVTHSFHGNSLSSPRPTIGYTLRDKTTGCILKYGETSNAPRRYTKKYLDKNNAELVPEATGTKREMHDWQHERIVEYKRANNGQRPPKNKSDYD